MEMGGDDAAEAKMKIGTRLGKVKIKQRYVSKGRKRTNGLMNNIIFDEDTFNEIRKMAIKKRTSFGEQVRLLVEWGLMEVKRAEK